MAQKDAPSKRIAENLRDRIKSGELVAGTRLPSTRTLAEQWGVARGTVDRALTQLRTEGLIRVEKGRAGTVVADAQLTELVLAVDGVRIAEIQQVEIIVLDAGQSAAIGLKPSSTVLKIELRLG